MGELADGAVNGEWCELCLFPFHESIRPLGYPGICNDCGGPHERMHLTDDTKYRPHPDNTKADGDPEARHA